MSPDIQVWSYSAPDGVVQEVRAVFCEPVGRYTVVAGDVCKVLGARTDNMIRHIEPSRRFKLPLPTSSGVQQMTTITAEGALVLASKVPGEAARTFGTWIVDTFAKMAGEQGRGPNTAPEPGSETDPSLAPLDIDALGRLVEMTKDLAAATGEAPPKALTRPLYRMLRHHAKGMADATLPPSRPRVVPQRAIAAPKDEEPC